MLGRTLASCSRTASRPYTTNAPKTVYVTTPIFYANAGPHIGHLYSTLLADTMTRYYAMLGHSTFLTTGTDEHGTKIQNAAANQPVGEYCTKISQQFREMCDTFDVDYSRFVRTTEDRHFNTVHHFWNVLEARGHIYMGKYSGWYCLSDEAFLSEIELIDKTDANGKPIKVSAASGNVVEWTEEDNYKFRLTNFQDDLKYWLKNEDTVRPEKFYKILRSWIEDDTYLQDVSVSRPTSRVPWGIPTPKNASHSVYVWLDALVNYLTCIGYPDDSYKQYWPASLQVIGKDILKFHGIYWPAFLIAAGLEPPRTLLCHSHWLVNDTKMSKSKKNVVCPFEARKIFTKYGLRYFLLREAVPYNDSTYGVTKVANIVNSELANTFGNLMNRCTGKGINPRREILQFHRYKDVLTSDVAVYNIESLESLGENARKSYESYNLHHAVDAIMELLHSSNKMFDHHKPWELSKESGNPDSVAELKAVISLALESVRVAALALQPIIPKISTELLDFMKVPRESRMWCDTVPLHLGEANRESKNFDKSHSVLFERINVN